jgi:hypothetical protein
MAVSISLLTLLAITRLEKNFATHEDNFSTVPAFLTGDHRSRVAARRQLLPRRRCVSKYLPFTPQAPAVALVGPWPRIGTLKLPSRNQSSGNSWKWDAVGVAVVLPRPGKTLPIQGWQCNCHPNGAEN